MTQVVASLLPNLVEVRTHDTRLLQHGEVMTVSHNEVDSAHPIQVATRRQADSGIMVLSSSCKVLYANKASHHFFRRLNRRENGHSTDGAFPVSVADLLDKILKSLEARTANRDRVRLQVKRLVVEQDQQVLVQGFGIPDRLDIQQSRIVLTIQEIALPMES
ncbi:MAG TPA: hypothetical protein VF819_06275 [Nitrospira sp.]